MNLTDQQRASIPATYLAGTLFPKSSDRPSPARTTYEAAYVRSLFNGIAPRYDLLNHLLSSGLDILWRKKAVDRLMAHRPRSILDVATGTADFAIEAARLRPERIVGVDIANEMLGLGRTKVARKRLEGLIHLQEGAAENLPFSPSSFDAATVGFGVRNFANLGQGLKEIWRVLRPGGCLIILEFSRPPSSTVRGLYNFYSRRVLPILGGLISRNREAYDYLPKTIQEFPDGDDFSTLLQSSGFREVTYERLTFGIVTLYHGIKHSS